MDRKLLTQLYNKLDDLIENDELTGKQIILFGANKPAEVTISYLVKKGFTVRAIIDNNSRKQNKTLNGVRVCKPDDLLGMLDEEYIILIASFFHKQMRSSISQYELSDSQIVETIYVAELSLKSDIFEKHTGIAINGWDVYKKIKSAYGDDVFIILIPCPSLGDAYFILSYIGEYAKSAGLSNYIVAMSGDGSHKVAEMFKGINYMIITQDDNDALLALYKLMNLQDVIIVSHRFPYTRLTDDYLGIGKLNWGEMIREVILGLDENVEKRLPHKSTTIKDDSLFEKLKHNKGKTVLLAPIAVHALSLPDTFWDALAEALILEGYTVVVNVAANESVRIKGAASLFIPIEDIIPFVERAGIFISLRNGLCDVLSEADAKKIALYADYEYLSSFGLKSIGLTDSFMEIAYENDQETIDAIIGYLGD